MYVVERKYCRYKKELIEKDEEEAEEIGGDCEREGKRSSLMKRIKRRKKRVTIWVSYRLFPGPR